MKACVFNGPRDLSVVEMPVPEPRPGEIILRTAAAGLCASDVRVYRGEKYAKQGVVPGHEVSGIVAGLGDGVPASRPVSAWRCARSSPAARASSAASASATAAPTA